MKSQSSLTLRQVVSWLGCLLILVLVCRPSPAPAYHWWNDPGTGTAAGSFVFYHWPSMPVTYIIDAEALPSGVTFAGSVGPAFDAWEDVPTSSLQFQQNANTTGISDFTWNKCAANPAATSPNWGSTTDDRNEVGWVHNADLGSGTYGRGITTVDTDTGEIIDFVLLVNVDNSSGTDPTFQGVLTHELGHVLGIGHTAVGSPDFTYFALPQADRATMFPYAQSGDNDRLETLELDDRLIVSRIYPETVNNPPDQVPFSLTQQMMSGTVTKGTDGSYARGAYVRLVNVADNDVQTGVLSDLQGNEDGKWDLPGLPPGQWYVVLNDLKPSDTIYPAWIEDDGVGSTAHTYYGFPDEHFDAAESNHDTAADKVAMPVWDNWNTHNVNLVTNEGSLPDPSITPWGVSATPPAPPWYQTADIWVDNDADGNVNESDEPLRGKSDNQLSARITNRGNANASAYRVVFAFRPYTTSSSAPKVSIGSVDETGTVAPGASRDYTVTWDLSDTFIQANFPPALWTADHFCADVTIAASGSGTLVDANPHNNHAQTNFTEVPASPSTGGFSKARFFAYNHKDEPAKASLEWVARAKGWNVRFEGIDNPNHIPMQPGEWLPVTVVLEPLAGASTPTRSEPVVIDITQRLDGAQVGGITVQLTAPKPSSGWAICQSTCFVLILSLILLIFIAVMVLRIARALSTSP